MQTTTDLFRRRIRQSGQRRTVADLYLSGMLVVQDLPVSSGSITADRNSGVRRSGTIVIQDRRLVNDILSGLLLPFGYEIRVRQGIVYPDRSEELIPLGIFMAYEVSWEESTGQIPTIQLFDRSKMMEDNQSTHTFGFPGHTFAAAMQEILRWHYPGLQIEFDDVVNTGLLIPGGTLYDQGSLLEIMQQMAAAIGGEFYFDANGVPQCRAVKKLEDYTIDDSVWDVNVGSEDGILYTANRSITRAGVYNKVTVYGNAGTDDTVQPVYQVGNIDPLSPARRFGPFGVVDLRIEDNTLKEHYQCQMLAVDKLAEVSRLATALDFTCVANPALEEGDIVTTTYTDQTSQLALLESITYPIDSNEQSGTCSIGRLGS